MLSPGYCHPRPIVIWPKSSILILTLLSLPLAFWGEFKFIFFKKLYTVKLAFRCVCISLSFNTCRDVCNYNSIPKPVPSCWHFVVRLSPPSHSPATTDLWSVPIVLSFRLLLFCLWGRLCFWECYIHRITVCHLLRLASFRQHGFFGSQPCCWVCHELVPVYYPPRRKVRMCLSFHCWRTLGCYLSLYYAYWTCPFPLPSRALLTVVPKPDFLISLCVFLLHDCLLRALLLESHSEKEKEKSVPGP